MSRALLLILFLAAAPLSAQVTPTIEAGASFAAARNVARDVGGTRVSDGTLLGAQVVLRASVFALRGEYFEGKVRQDGTGPDVGIVEGNAVLSAQFHPWISIGLGVRAHHEDDAQPERWLAWTLGGRFEAPIIGRNLRAHGEFHQGIGGTVNFPQKSVDARSGEVGLTILFSRSPVWVGIGSRIDEEEGAGRIRTRQRLAVTIGFAR